MATSTHCSCRGPAFKGRHSEAKALLCVTLRRQLSASSCYFFRKVLQQPGNPCLSGWVHTVTQTERNREHAFPALRKSTRHLHTNSSFSTLTIHKCRFCFVWWGGVGIPNHPNVCIEGRKEKDQKSPFLMPPEQSLELDVNEMEFPFLSNSRKRYKELGMVAYSCITALRR